MRKEYCDCCGKENTSSKLNDKVFNVLWYGKDKNQLYAELCNKCSIKVFKIARTFTDKEIKVKK